ncbi:MAG TPA: hypothetical protein VHM01_23835 [Alphaproteobacteria bacterium]|nr:hypothetical protein [Alphaproteobacteria bacterium]
MFVSRSLVAAAALFAPALAVAQTVTTVPASPPSTVIVTQPNASPPVVVTQPAPVVVTQPLPSPAPYTPPPVGSVIQTSAGTFTVTGSSGYDLVLQKDAQAGGGFTTLHGLFQREPENTATYSRREVESLWPLQIGKRGSTDMITQQGGRNLRWDVVRTDTVTVPAGTFPTYVVEKRERSSDDSYLATERWWYAPQLGFPVKYEQELVRGIERYAPWELVSIRYPGAPVAGVQVVPGYQPVGVPLRADTAENRAAFCRERGTTLLTTDGRRVVVDCDTYVRTDTASYQAWLAR